MDGGREGGTEGERDGGTEGKREEGRDGGKREGGRVAGMGRERYGVNWIEGGRWGNRGIEMKEVGGSDGGRERVGEEGDGGGGRNHMQYMNVQIYRFNRP